MRSRLKGFKLPGFIDLPRMRVARLFLGTNITEYSMRHTFTLLAFLARFVTALVLPVERDDTSAEQLGDCEVWEYYGQISQLADDIGMCLTVVGNSAENGKPVSV